MATSPTSSSATAAAAAAAGDSSDGPVLSVVSKRLRNLRKKYNRILQMEESLAAGKILNREQEDVLRSKPIVTALIDELDRLRLPLSSALSEELSSRPPPPPLQAAPASDDAAVDDLLALFYFGSLFDVKEQSEFVATMVARTHERSCCITYDYVTDEAADLLVETDLDAVSALAALAAARPAAAAGVSHSDALRACARHARLWLRRADEPIHPGSNITYAAVRAKLDRIMASDYYTAQPEMKATMDVAAAVGKYGGGGVQVPESVEVSPEAPVPEAEGSSAHEGQKDEQEDFQATEIHYDHQSPVVDEAPKMDEEALVNPPEEVPSTESEQEKFEADVEEPEQRDSDPKDQHFIPHRSYQNQRGGGRGGGRRGYSNGRGGRGGRGGVGGGGYQNGRGGGGGYYYDSGYYQQRNYNNNNRGRGGRSGGNSMYNNHGGAPHGGHTPPGRVELGANA